MCVHITPNMPLFKQKGPMYVCTYDMYPKHASVTLGLNPTASRTRIGTYLAAPTRS